MLKKSKNVLQTYRIDRALIVIIVFVISAGIGLCNVVNAKISYECEELHNTADTNHHSIYISSSLKELIRNKVTGERVVIVLLRESPEILKIKTMNIPYKERSMVMEKSAYIKNCKDILKNYGRFYNIEFKYKILNLTTGKPEYGIYREHYIPYLNAFIMKVSIENIEKIAKLPFVKEIWDGEIKLDIPDTVNNCKPATISVLNDSTIKSVRQPYEWDVLVKSNWGIEATNVDKLHKLGYKGRGIIIAVIDSGFDSEHPLANPLFEEGHTYDPNKVNILGVAFPPLGNWDDEEGHGTAVTGVIWQCAPEAYYLIADTLTPIGVWNFLGMIDWAKRNGAQIIATSLAPRGCQRNPCNWENCEICRAVNIAADENTIIATAAGNWWILQNGRYRECDIYPVCPGNGPNVISVSSIMYNYNINSIQIYYNASPHYSYRGKPDIAAPGYAVCSLDLNAPPNHTNVSWWSGSSFAQPHVSGIVALLLSAVKSSTGHVNGLADDIREAILNTAIDLPDTDLDGKGKVDALGAYAYLMNDNNRPDPKVDIQWIDVSEDSVTFRVILSNDGDSSKLGGGVHLHLEGAEFVSADKGSFTKVSNTNKDLLIYIDSIDHLEKAISGEIRIRILNEKPILKYRAWIYDDDNAVYVPESGFPQPWTGNSYDFYVARYPKENVTNPPYDKHIYNRSFSILDYSFYEISIPRPVPKILKVKAELDKQEYKPSQNAVLTVTVYDENANPVSGAKVSYIVKDSSDVTIREDTCLDKGNGKYEAKFNVPSTIGSYIVEITVEKEGYQTAKTSVSFDVINPAEGHNLRIYLEPSECNLYRPGNSVSFEIQVDNIGKYSEDVTVTLIITNDNGYHFSKSKHIGILKPKHFKSFSMYWQIPSNAKGCYLVEAKATSPSGDEDFSDNRASTVVCVEEEITGIKYKAYRYKWFFLEWDENYQIPDWNYKGAFHAEWHAPNGHTYKIEIGALINVWHDDEAIAANIYKNGKIIYKGLSGDRPIFSNLLRTRYSHYFDNYNLHIWNVEIWEGVGGKYYVSFFMGVPTWDVELVPFEQHAIVGKETTFTVKLPSGNYEVEYSCSSDGCKIDYAWRCNNNDQPNILKETIRWFKASTWYPKDDFTIIVKPRSVGRINFAIAGIEFSDRSNEGYMVFGVLDVGHFYDVAVKNIYVNPSNPRVGDVITIKNEIENKGTAPLTDIEVHTTILDSNGNVIKTFQKTANAGEITFEWDTTGLSAGTYTIKTIVYHPKDMDKTNNVLSKQVTIQPPPALKVTVTIDKNEYKLGETIKINAKVSTTSDNSISDAIVKATIIKPDGNKDVLILTYNSSIKGYVGEYIPNLIGSYRLNVTASKIGYKTGYAHISFTIKDWIMHLDVKPNSWKMKVNEEMQFKAMAYWASGKIEDVTSKATWFSNNTSVLVHLGNGKFKAKAEGFAIVMATYKSKNDSSYVTVFQVVAPIAVFTYTPIIPLTGEKITFNAILSYDPDGYIIKYIWYFGDGNTTITTQPTVTHIYYSEGKYKVTLIVMDNSMLTNSTSKLVQVKRKATLIAPSGEIPFNSSKVLQLYVENVTDITELNLTITYDPKIVWVKDIQPALAEIGFMSVDTNNIDGIVNITITTLSSLNITTIEPVVDIIFQSVGNIGEITFINITDAKFSNKSINITYEPNIINGTIRIIWVKGDFNNNGRIDIGDVVKVACMVVGKLSQDLRADFNNNGRVDIGDLVKIAYYLLGKIEEL